MEEDALVHPGMKYNRTWKLWEWVPGDQSPMTEADGACCCRGQGSSWAVVLDNGEWWWQAGIKNKKSNLFKQVNE